MGRLARHRGAATLVLAVAMATTAAAGELPLGAGEAELRARYGEALREVRVERVRSLHEQVGELLRPQPGAPEAGAVPDAAPAPVEAAPDPYAGQRRLARSLPEGDARRVEYDLYDGRVYRIRWLLAERFERPLMDALVASLAQRVGPPRYDQTIEAKLGSGRADLRRSGWEREGSALEIRQLHPFVGGPVFVTLSDVSALQAIVDARATALPQPETTGDWWLRPQQSPKLLAPKDRDELVAALDALVAALPYPVAATARPDP
jgi:hypothetical protein